MNRTNRRAVLAPLNPPASTSVEVEAPGPHYGQDVVLRRVHGSKSVCTISCTEMEARHLRDWLCELLGPPAGAK